jgi:ferredoxin
MTKECSAPTPDKSTYKKRAEFGYYCQACGAGAAVYDTKRIKLRGKVFIRRHHRCVGCGRTARTVEQES